MANGYVIVKVMKDLDGKPTSNFVGIAGVSASKENAVKVAKEKSAKSHNYVYIVVTVKKY